MALTKPFAENGNKTTIPETTVDGSVSYDQGFGSFYALPPEEGGLFIDRAQFNQLMYDTTSQVLDNKAAIATKANADDTVNLTGNQNIQGIKTFINNIVSPNITAMQNNLNTIFSSTTSPVISQTTIKVINVGTGGDFETLQDAFAEAIKYTSRVTVRLISDLNTTNNISITGINGRNIFLNFNNFKINNTSSQTYSFALNNSHIGSIINLNLQGYIFACGNNASTYLTEKLNIQNGNFGYADCIRSWNNSRIGIPDNTPIVLSHGANQSSFYATEGSIISVGQNSTITDNSADGICFRVLNGGIITTSGATLNISATKANQAANTPTNNGIIFGNYSL